MIMALKQALKIYKQHWDIVLLLYFLGYFPFYMLDLVLYQTLDNNNSNNISLLVYVYPTVWDFMPWTLAALPLSIYLSAYFKGQSYTFVEYVFLWLKHVWAILFMLLVASYFLMSIQQTIFFFLEEWLAFDFFQALIQPVWLYINYLIIVSLVFIPIIMLSVHPMNMSHPQLSFFKYYAFLFQSSLKDVKTVIKILLINIIADNLLIIISNLLIAIVELLNLPVIYYIVYLLTAVFIYSGSILIIYTTTVKGNDITTLFNNERRSMIYE